MKIKIGSDSLGSSVSKEQLSDRLDRKEIVRGTALTITGGFLWGLAGVFGKYSFEYKGVMAPWLVNVRLIIAGIILLIRSYVIGLYNITPETKQIAWKLMDAIALIVVFQSVNGVMTKGVLRGGGDTRFLMVADVLFLWIVSVPLGALAGLYWHLDVFWIYVFLKLDQVIKAVWCVFRLKSRKWIKMLSTQLI